jgi:hypothetical protein
MIGNGSRACSAGGAGVFVFSNCVALDSQPCRLGKTQMTGVEAIAIRQATRAMMVMPQTSGVTRNLCAALHCPHCRLMLFCAAEQIANDR